MLNLPTSDDTDSLGGSENSSSNSTFSLNRTVRDYGQKINSLQRENFDLKLRIFLLEERLSVKDRTEVPSPLHQYHADQQVGPEFYFRSRCLYKAPIDIKELMTLYGRNQMCQQYHGPIRNSVFIRNSGREKF